MDFKIAEKNGLVIASIEGQIRISTQDDFMEHLDSLCDSRGLRPFFWIWRRYPI